MTNDNDKTLLIFNLKRFIKTCEKSKYQTTTNGLKLKDINGTFRSFKIKPTFGSGNLVKRPALAFLKDDNEVSKGIYPIIVYISDRNELITCKGVSYDNKSSKKWRIINENDVPFTQTIYNDEKGKFSFLRNSYSLDKLDDLIIEKIIQDIINIIEDY